MFLVVLVISLVQLCRHPLPVHAENPAWLSYSRITHVGNMTVRTYVATQCMAARLTRPGAVGYTSEALAILALRDADALLDQLGYR